MPPRPVNHIARALGVALNVHAPRQADLPGVRVPAEHEVIAGRRGVAVDLRRVREQDRWRAGRDRLARAMQVVGLVEVRIVHTGEIEAGTLALQHHRLVEQESVAGRFQRRHELDEVVIAEDGVHRRLEVAHQLGGILQRQVVGAAAAGAEVAGDDAEIVGHILQAADDGARQFRVDVEMQVAQVKQGEAVECPGQRRQEDVVLHTLDVEAVPSRPRIEAAHLERVVDEDHEPLGVLDVHQRAAAAEQLAGMVDLDRQPLAQMRLADARHEVRIGVRRVVHGIAPLDCDCGQGANRATDCRLIHSSRDCPGWIRAKSRIKHAIFVTSASVFP